MLVMIHDDSTAAKAALLVRIAPPLFTYVAFYLEYKHMSRWTLIKRSDIATCLLSFVAFFDKTHFGKFYLCKQKTRAFTRKMFNDLTRRLQTPTQTFKGVKRKETGRQKINANISVVVCSPRVLHIRFSMPEIAWIGKSGSVCVGVCPSFEKKEDKRKNKIK